MGGVFAFSGGFSPNRPQHTAKFAYKTATMRYAFSYILFTPSAKTPPEAVYGPYRKVLNLFQKRKRI